MTKPKTPPATTSADDWIGSIHLPTMRTLAHGLEKIAPAEVYALRSVVAAKMKASDDNLATFLAFLKGRQDDATISEVPSSKPSPSPSPFGFHFRTELARVLNRHSMENGSNTPDFILADLLSEVLHAFNKAAAARERWYGRGPEFMGSSAPEGTGHVNLPKTSGFPKAPPQDKLLTLREHNAKAFKDCNALAGFGGTTQFAIRWVSHEDGDEYFDHLGQALARPTSFRESPLDYILDYYESEQRLAAAGPGDADLPPTAAA